MLTCVKMQDRVFDIYKNITKKWIINIHKFIYFREYIINNNRYRERGKIYVIHTKVHFSGRVR